MKTHNKQLNALTEQEGLSAKSVSMFQGLIWQHYHEHGRTFPWRETQNPYHILVSEIMLQQTQTSRVSGKYEEFITAYPDFFALARAPLKEVLRIWQGLGYNRRALALHRTAREIVSHYHGMLPSDPEVLRQLPGIGRYTASAIGAIAFNQPAVFIETNIRAVFLHFFFKESDGVVDRDILPLVEATLDRNNPREWYYALFDYGALLKRSREGGASLSRPHRQSTFQGSNRQMRGQILRLLLGHTPMSETEIVSALGQNADRVIGNLRQLQKEGFLKIEGDMIHVK